MNLTPRLALALLLAAACGGCGTSTTGAGGMMGRTGTGGAAGSAAGAAGTAGQGGGCGVLECLRAYQCVARCGGPVEYTGCCPCVSPLFDSTGACLDAKPGP